MFTSITSDQITSVHKLYFLLRKLKVIGLVETTTDRRVELGYAWPPTYSLRFIRYRPEMKGKFTPDEALTMLTMWGELLETGAASS